ncbi:MAG: glycosyltransferase, partial [Candidatus Omnitrophica bacterium]|nr:glycosyltransferase [Candidatus Omnitrophota bacterium]
MKARRSDPFNGKSFVSVVIPTFNAKAHLLLLLESLRGQSVRGFEVIVVDD